MVTTCSLWNKLMNWVLGKKRKQKEQFSDSYWYFWKRNQEAEYI